MLKKLTWLKKGEKKLQLHDIVNEYNYTYHRTTKMKLVDFKGKTYINSTDLHSMELHSNKEVNDKDPKFKVGDHVRISQYKNIFANWYTPNWSEEVFVIKKSLTYVVNDLNGEEIIVTFYEKEVQKTNQQEFRIEKVIKKRW